MSDLSHGRTLRIAEGRSILALAMRAGGTRISAFMTPSGTLGRGRHASDPGEASAIDVSTGWALAVRMCGTCMHHSLGIRSRCCGVASTLAVASIAGVFAIVGLERMWVSVECILRLTLVITLDVCSSCV